MTNIDILTRFNSLLRPVWLLAALVAVPTALVAAQFNVRDYGATGNGSTDDTRALKSAAAAARSLGGVGATLLIPAGNYLYTDNIVIDSINVVGAGTAATQLVTTNVDHSAWRLIGTNPTITNLTIAAPFKPTVRKTTSDTSGIDVYNATGFSLRNCLIINMGSTGIVVRSSGGTPTAHALIQSCEIHDSLADGIHIIGGSHDVDVNSNYIHATGDDLISVVSYILNGGLCYNISITNNDIADQVWGRGISVSGGHSITIGNNTISNSPCSGIYVASESYWNTYDCNDITVSNNLILKCPNVAAGGQASILIAGRNDNGTTFAASQVTVSGNTVKNSMTHGILLQDYAQNVGITGNAISNIANIGVFVYHNTINIAVGSAASGNSISYCGLYGIAVVPDGSSGYLTILNNWFDSVNSQRLSYVDVINIAPAASSIVTTIQDNVYTNTAGYPIERFIEAWTPLHAVISNQGPANIVNTFTLGR